MFAGLSGSIEDQGRTGTSPGNRSGARPRFFFAGLFLAGPFVARVAVLVSILALASVVAPLSARPADPTLDRFAAVRLPTISAQDADGRDLLDALEAEVRRVAADPDSAATHVVLPELPIAHFAPETVPGPTTERLADLARELDVWLAVSLPEQSEGGYFVTAILVDDQGRLRSQRRKVMPGAPDLAADSTATSDASGESESAEFHRGSPRQVAEVVDDGLRTLAVLPADDLRTGVPLLAGRGAEVILAPGGPAIPGTRTALAEKLAREHGVSLVLAAPASAAADVHGTGVYGAIGRRLTPADDRPSVLAALPTRGYGWRPPTDLGLPPVPMPAPADPRLAELGRRLFFDTGLSRDDTVSCATCHDPQQGFANGEKGGEGVTGQRTARNVIGLLNVAHKPLLFWDGYASSLENQAKYPTSHALEMDRGYLDEVPAYVASQEHYARGFAELGIRQIDFDTVAAALSTYQRTLGSGTSPFDRFYFGGDETALSASARRGWELFRGRAGCIDCHAVDVDGALFSGHALFSDHEFHNTGVGFDPQTGEHADLGLGWISDARKAGLFFTPSLRSVALTAPYMHDGSLASLRQVVEFYDRGGVENPRLDRRIRPLGLEEGEIDDLVHFLEALTGDAVYDAQGRPVVAGGRSPKVAKAADRAAGDARWASMNWTAAILHLPTPSLEAAFGGSSVGKAVDPVAELLERVERRRELVAVETARVAREGVRVVLLPEYVETGEPGELELDAAGLAALAERQWQSGLEFYGRLARRQGVHLLASLFEPVVAVVGSVEQEYGAPEAPYHALVLFDPDGVPVSKHRKLSIVASRGDGLGTAGREREVRAVDTALGRLGILSGDDLGSTLPRLGELGAELVLVAASWRETDAVDWRRAVDELPPPGMRLLVARLEEGRSAFVRPWPSAANVTSVSVARAVTDAAGQRVPGGQRLVVELETSIRPGAALGLPPVPERLPARFAPASLAPASFESLTSRRSSPTSPKVLPASTVTASSPGIDSATDPAVELGRRLFFDPRLSATGDVACATCHAPEHFFADGRRFPRGVEGREGKNNTPTVVNSVYRPSVFWRGDVPSLEAQVERALRGWAEMNTHPSMAVAHIEAIPEYSRAFHRLTGREGIELADVSAVLARFERTLLAGDSDFDRWYFGGDDSALDARERRGFEVFVGDGRCVDCHAIGRDAALFTDQDFHNTGVGYHPRFEYLGYGGDGLESNMARKITFRGEYLTPSLRDVALTAPYMHDGSVPDLEAVVEFYDRGGIANPRMDARLHPLGLDRRQKDDLVAFLQTLTSRTTPEVEVPSPAPVPAAVASTPEVDDERKASMR